MPDVCRSSWQSGTHRAAWAVAAAAVWAVHAQGTHAHSEHAACRDKLAWPFAQASIWNMPIGSGAKFQAANIFALNMTQPGNFHHDDDHIWIQMSDSDPVTPWYEQGG